MSSVSRWAASIKSSAFATAIIGLALGAFSCSRSSPSPGGPTSANPSPSSTARKITSTGVVNARPQPAELSAGGSGSAVVHLVIEKGFHVNANPPTFPYLIATELQIKPAEGITVGKVEYPAAKKAKFAFAEEELAVYEGDTEVKAELKVDKGAAVGNRSLNAVLRIQACDDKVCYPPGKMDLQIPVTIK